MKKLLIVAVTSALFGLTSCDKMNYLVEETKNNNTETKNVICTEEVRPGVTLYLSNEDGKPFFVEGKLVNIKTGEVEYLKADEKQTTQPINALYEKAGVYDIYLYAKGYEPVVLSAVTIDADACHVKTVSMKAFFKLQNITDNPCNHKSPGVLLHLGNEDGVPFFVEGKLLNLKTGEIEYLQVHEEQSTQPMAALFGKPGVYDIYLYAKGYEPVVLKNIQVNQGFCGLVTVDLKAYFTKTPIKIDDPVFVECLTK